ncbi:MAG: response regulator [Gammaproteobacteria bacterium]|nr:response regulator [Gammaproteobacteria bacterium]
MAYNNRILIVDDDPEILKIFKTVLNGSGAAKEIDPLNALLTANDPDVNKADHRHFVVDIAQQGEQAYNMIKQAIEDENPYAILFTDMRMPPGWDGVRTAKEVRKLDQYIEIIVVTAFADSSISEIVHKVGFTDRLLYLKKPFDDEEILQLADSLSMRWNLERKVMGMLKVLEGMVDSFFNLKTAIYEEDHLEPFLTLALKHISNFLDTPDVFVARLENGETKIKIGLGKFNNGLSQSDNFISLLKKAVNGDPISKVIRIDQYVVMPISMHKCQDVIVGLINEREIEGTDQLLQVLARDLSKVFDTIASMSELRQEMTAKDKRIAELEAMLEN